MIKEVQMFTMVCDNCKEIHEDEYSGIVAWTTPESAHEVAMDSDWDRMNGKDYCPKCYYTDDEDNFCIKTERFKE